MRTATVPVLTNPKLLDVVLARIDAVLLSKLLWLDHAFGKASTLKREQNGREVSFPAVYVGKKEYLNLFPDGHIGNYSFFSIEDGQDVKPQGGRNEFECRFSFIVWFDYRKVYGLNWQNYSIENVKAEVLEALRGTITGAQLRISSVYEQAGNIYQGYTDKEIDNQFLMRPYGGLRIDGTLKYNEKQSC